jgi:hypothetical protein
MGSSISATTNLQIGRIYLAWQGKREGRYSNLLEFQPIGSQDVCISWSEWNHRCLLIIKGDLNAVIFNTQYPQAFENTLRCNTILTCNT